MWFVLNQPSDNTFSTTSTTTRNTTTTAKRRVYCRYTIRPEFYITHSLYTKYRKIHNYKFRYIRLKLPIKNIAKSYVYWQYSGNEMDELCYIKQILKSCRKY